MRPLSIEQMHDQMFAMLCWFADFCDANGIRYYLCGGTLLGAVRHHDFIPWDDDMDVLVPRPDYERLKVLFKQQSIAPYRRLDASEGDITSAAFLRLVDTKTWIPGQRLRHPDALWLDIFPMDGLPDGKLRCAVHLSFASFRKRWQGCAVCDFGVGSTPLRAVLRPPFQCIAKLAVRLYGDDFWVNRINRLARRYDFDACEYVGGVVSSLGPCERMRKEDYLPVEEISFRDRTFHAPKCWDAYLRALYGDYMRLPPGWKRRQHNEKVFWRDEAGDVAGACRSTASDLRDSPDL